MALQRRTRSTTAKPRVWIIRANRGAAQGWRIDRKNSRLVFGWRGLSKLKLASLSAAKIAGVLAGPAARARTAATTVTAKAIFRLMSTARVGDMVLVVGTGTTISYRGTIRNWTGRSEPAAGAAISPKLQRGYWSLPVEWKRISAAARLAAKTIPPSHSIGRIGHKEFSVLAGAHPGLSGTGKLVVLPTRKMRLGRNPMTGSVMTFGRGGKKKGGGGGVGRSVGLGSAGQRAKPPGRSGRYMAMAPPPPKVDPGGTRTLFYATDRARSGSAAPDDRYGNDRGGLEFGFCDVSIPPGHTKGDLERPWKFWIISGTQDPKKHVVLENVKPVAEDAFRAELSHAVTDSVSKDAFLFIHGYNTSFAEAARRTGQVTYDLGFTGVSGFFSWPSAGEVLGYIHDLDNSTWSVPHFESLVRLLLAEPALERLHLVAHSMGNNVLTLSLKDLATEAALRERLSIIHQIILCAPDVDRGVFENQLLPAMRDIGLRRTLYASDHDLALNASQVVRGGLPRLGYAGGNLFVAGGLDTVDASNVQSEGMGHDYFASATRVVDDIFHLLRNDLPPADRNLRSRQAANALLYWLFPD